MQAQRNFTSVNVSNAETAALLAKLAMVEPATVVVMLSHGNTEELIDLLSGHPGALERLLRADETPRWMKVSLNEALESAGFRILS